MSCCLPGRSIRLVLVGLLVLTLWAAGCQRRKPEGKKPAEIAKEPGKQRIEAQFKKARIIWHDEQGRKLFEARFEKAFASQEGRAAEVKLLGVKASLYSGGKVASTLVAPEVTANSETREIRASHGVRVVSVGEQTSASAEQIIWKAREDRLIGEGGVRLIRGGIQARARSLVADTALGKTTLTGDAQISLSE